MKKRYIAVLFLLLCAGIYAWAKTSGIFYDFMSFENYREGIIFNAPSALLPVEPYKKTDEESVQFFAVGCAGTGNKGQFLLAESMAKLAADSTPDFVLYLGDNFYGRGVSSVTDVQWQSKFEDVFNVDDLPMPFYAVLGNHDYYRNPDAQVAYSEKSSRWRMPARYYSFERVLADGTKIEFFGLDTQAVLKGRGNDQLKWLEKKLRDSRAVWKVVYGHHPIYSDAFKYMKEIGEMRQILEPIFIRHKVDIYVSAHNHSIEVFKAQSGVRYVVSGAGSRPRNVRWNDKTAFAHADIGFVWIRLMNNSMGIGVVGKEGQMLYNDQIFKDKVDSEKEF